LSYLQVALGRRPSYITKDVSLGNPSVTGCERSNSDASDSVFSFFGMVFSEQKVSKNLILGHFFSITEWPRTAGGHAQPPRGHKASMLYRATAC
jgi:hypothetical protein